MKKVIVTVEGGVVQNVEVPEGVVVHVQDFDVEGMEPDDKRLVVVEDGDDYSEAIYDGGPIVPKSTTHVSDLQNVLAHLQLIATGQPSQWSNAEAIRMLSDGLREVHDCLDEFTALGEDESRGGPDGPYSDDVETAERLVKELAPIVNV